MDIKRIVSHAIVLLRHDEIPLQRLSQRTNIVRLGSVFEFNQFELIGDDSGNRAVSGQAGSFRDETGDYPIARLVVEERRILLAMEASSDVVDRVVEKALEFLSSLTNPSHDDHLKPLLVSYESEIIAHMDFTVDKLVPTPMYRIILSDGLLAAASPVARTTVALEQVQFQLNFDPIDPIIDKNGITLSQKAFTIGPRPNVPIEEQIYFSKAPFETEKHIMILSRVEAALKQS